MHKLAQEHRQAGLAKLAMRALLVAILSTVGLAACGDSSTSPAAESAGPGPGATPVPSESPLVASTSSARGVEGTAFDACALLTAPELSKILGNDGVQVKAMPSGGWVAGQCAWNGPGSGFFLSVGTATSIKAFGDPATPNAMAMLAQFKKQASATGIPKDATGIGDGGVLTATGIAAYTGTTYLQVTNLGITEDQLTEIAKLVVAQLRSDG